MYDETKNMIYLTIQNLNMFDGSKIRDKEFFEKRYKYLYDIIYNLLSDDKPLFAKNIHNEKDYHIYEQDYKKYHAMYKKHLVEDILSYNIEFFLKDNIDINKIILHQTCIVCRRNASYCLKNGQMEFIKNINAPQKCYPLNYKTHLHFKSGRILLFNATENLYKLIDLFTPKNNYINYIKDRTILSKKFSRILRTGFFYVGNTSPKIYTYDNDIFISNQKDNLLFDKNIEQYICHGFISTDLWWLFILDSEIYKKICITLDPKNGLEIFEQDCEKAIMLNVEQGKYICNNYYQTVMLDEKSNLPYLSLKKV